MTGGGLAVQLGAPPHELFRVLECLKRSKTLLEVFCLARARSDLGRRRPFVRHSKENRESSGDRPQTLSQFRCGDR